MARGKAVSAKDREAKLEADKEYRKKIFEKLKDHLRRGYSLDCFAEISETAIRRYLSIYKDEFSQDELDEAQREGKLLWEGIGYRQADGKCLGNSKAWWYNMAHRYKWSDRVHVEAQHSGQVAVSVVSYASQKASECSESAKDT